eukprot:Hpha_TRINITY_DN26326_c0_g1::TRINITY_DN26326_c0_g1_i1::g.9461::m.9461
MVSSRVAFACRRPLVGARRYFSGTLTGGSVHALTYFDVPGERIGEIAQLSSPLYGRAKKVAGVRNYSFLFARNSVDGRRTVILKELHDSSESLLELQQEKADLMAKAQRFADIARRQILAPAAELKKLSGIADTQRWVLDERAVIRAPARQGPDSAVGLVMEFEVDEGRGREFEEAVSPLYERIEAESHLLGFSHARREETRGVVLCVSTFQDANALIAHLRNTDVPLQQILTVSRVSRLEVHCSAMHQQRIAPPLEGFDPEYFFLDAKGIRR